MTLAMNFIIHGEAVRFNRGKGSSDDFDFKYMKGAGGVIVPYVSSQCYKRYWREALFCEKSPITTNKNQAYTSGNPNKYVDDDLFGYMIAGAKVEENTETEEIIMTPDEVRSRKEEILKASLSDIDSFVKNLERNKDPIPGFKQLIKPEDLQSLQQKENWSEEKKVLFVKTLL